jgi:putative PIN family toxin of toxin-antitoxin system
VADRYETPPIVIDTSVVVAGACRHESSPAYLLLMATLSGRVPLMLTPTIVLEYLDVLQRPQIMELTGLTRDQSCDLVTDMVALSHRIQLRYPWRPNLRDEDDNKFVEAAIHGAAVIVTYNLSDFRQIDMRPYGWCTMTPREFLARYLS